ncbi:hypothetical protein B1218_35245 [Pseudomonas ogarae]|nr:hypothetical protein B1218_35245 [Pseudomonas ogarae]
MPARQPYPCPPLCRTPPATHYQLPRPLFPPPPPPPPPPPCRSIPPYPVISVPPLTPALRLASALSPRATLLFVFSSFPRLLTCPAPFSPSPSPPAAPRRSSHV